MQRCLWCGMSRLDQRRKPEVHNVPSVEEGGVARWFGIAGARLLGTDVKCPFGIDSMCPFGKAVLGLGCPFGIVCHFGIVCLFGIDGACLFGIAGA